MKILVWLAPLATLAALAIIITLEKQIMSKIDDATARLEASGAANTAALTQLIAAAQTEIQQVADALNQPAPDTDALAARLNTVGDALDAAVTASNAAIAQLAADDPAAAPAGGGSTGTGTGTGTGDTGVGHAAP